VAGALVGGLALFSAAGSRGEKPRGKGAPDSAYTDRSPTNGVGDAQEVEAFFDELIPGQLEERHIPGATVAVVRYGRLLLAKGYGWADVEEQEPVAAERTLFHIGSNTKLFTWTAVMQLVEEGRLDLDADVNAYLDFRIPDTYPPPITLKHLMTHTAGFENRDIGMAASSPETVVPIGRWLATHIPARVRQPGVEAGYSNYGTGLAGYILERVSRHALRAVYRAAPPRTARHAALDAQAAAAARASPGRGSGLRPQEGQLSRAAAPNAPGRM
jgi:CubicO group peptidase (beta-lactamase class C family)